MGENYYHWLYTKAEWESFVLALLPSLDSTLSRSPFQRIALDLLCVVAESQNG